MSKLMDIVDNYEEDDLIDIFEIVLALRKDRKMMVIKFYPYFTLIKNIL